MNPGLAQPSLSSIRRPAVFLGAGALNQLE
jgi:hypothetical protein